MGISKEFQQYLDDCAKDLKDPAGYIKTYSGILVPTDKAPEPEDVSINCYELEGSPVGSVMERWRKYTEDKLFSKMKEDEVDTPHGRDIVYEQLKPRVKWFRPPLTLKIWKFEIDMTWAYKVEKRYLLKNCYPTSMGIIEGMDVSKAGDPPKEITFNWNCTPFKGPELEAKAKKLKENYDTDVLWEVEKNPELEDILKKHINDLHQNLKDQEDRIRRNWPDA